MLSHEIFETRKAHLLFAGPGEMKDLATAIARASDAEKIAILLLGDRNVSAITREAVSRPVVQQPPGFGDGKQLEGGRRYFNPTQRRKEIPNRRWKGESGALLEGVELRRHDGDRRGAHAAQTGKVYAR